VRIALPLLASLLAIPALAASSARAGDTIDPIVPGEVVVRAETPKALSAALSALSSGFGGVGVVDSIEGRPIYLISYELGPKQTADQVDLLLDNLTRAGVLAWNELNYAGQTGEGQTGSLWLSGVGLDAGAFANQYARDLLGLDLAHARSRGAGVVVAVIDTGIDASHPALGGRVSTLGASFVAGSASTADTGNGIDDDGDGLVDEQVGHGTFVAGLVHLVAPDAAILPVRVLDDEGIAGNFQISKALAWAIDRGADVVNMSLGETYRSAALEDIVDEARMAGMVVVGAAGNLDQERLRVFPACDDNAIGVAALDWSDVRAPFSNYNERLNLSAPGDSAIVDGTVDPARAIVGPVPGGAFAAWEGTSFATAFTSGLAALVLAQHPDWPTKAVSGPTVLSTVLAHLAASSVPISAQNPGYTGLLGAGRIDAATVTLFAPVAPPLGDLDLDRMVDAVDLGILLGSWGPCEPSLRADLNADGKVDAVDLGILLGAW
jgi:subtilisin family serine protease